MTERISIGFVFLGQSAQQAGMGADLADAYPALAEDY